MKYLLETSRTPIDSVARKVVFSKGIHFNCGKKFRCNWENPKKLVNIKCNLDNFIDFTGIRFGRLHVLGKTYKTKMDKKTNAPAQWIVRCSCGRYEGMYAKDLKRKMKYSNEMCQMCRYIYNIFLNSSVRSYGLRSILPNEYRNMIGKIFGSFTVVSTLEELFINNPKNPIKQSQWIVKCKCGEITKRTYTQLIKNKYNLDYFCNSCNERRNSKMKDYYKTHGNWPEEELVYIDGFFYKELIHAG